MSKFNFSVVIAAYNSDLWIKKTINSLINQNLDFEKNIEIIIVNDGSTDNTSRICQEYKAKYPKNIIYIENKENLGPAAARNIGLKRATGKYVNFLDSDDYISSNTFNSILNFFNEFGNEVDLVSIPIYFFGENKGEHVLNFKYAKKNNVVDLIENPLSVSEDVVFINQLLLKKPKIGYCRDGKYYYRKREDKTSLIDNSSFKKDYFNERAKHYFKFLIDKSIEQYDEVPSFIQYTIMYDLQWMFDISSVNNILTVVELNELRKQLYEILQYIDDDVIFNQKNIPNMLKGNILFFKYKKLKNTREYKNIEKIVLNRLKLNTVYIDVFEIIDNTLHILGDFPTMYNNAVDVYVNDKKIESEELQFPQRDKYSLSYKYGTNYSFKVKIP